MSLQKVHNLQLSKVDQTVITKAHKGQLSKADHNVIKKSTQSATI